MWYFRTSSASAGYKSQAMKASSKIRLTPHVLTKQFHCVNRWDCPTSPTQLTIFNCSACKPVLVLAMIELKWSATSHNCTNYFITFLLIQRRYSPIRLMSLIKDKPHSSGDFWWTFVLHEQMGTMMLKGKILQNASQDHNLPVLFPQVWLRMEGRGVDRLCGRCSFDCGLHSYNLRDIFTWWAPQHCSEDCCEAWL